MIIATGWTVEEIYAHPQDLLEEIAARLKAQNKLDKERAEKLKPKGRKRAD